MVEFRTTEKCRKLPSEKHPDKTFIGRIEPSFNFLGYHFIVRRAKAGHRPEKGKDGPASDKDEDPAKLTGLPAAKGGPKVGCPWL